jgi:hypothetical protein
LDDARFPQVPNLTKRKEINMINEIKAAVAELEFSGIIERTGEMRWAARSREWQPGYALTEVGRALSAAGIGLDDYQSRTS